MLTTLLLTALFGCGSPAEAPAEAAAAPAAAPAPATTPPQPDPLPPPTPPLGGPLVLIPGQYLADEIKLADGEEVQVLCKRELLTARVELVAVGEGRIHPTVAACPDYVLMFRGISDRIGSGSIRPGIGKGPFGAAKPRDYEGGYDRGVFRVSDPDPEKPGYTVMMDPDEGDAFPLFEMTEGPGTVGLNWIGDLDDDNVPDFVMNSPHSHDNHHLRLFLSAKSKDRRPEQVVETRFSLW